MQAETWSIWIIVNEHRKGKSVNNFYSNCGKKEKEDCENCNETTLIKSVLVQLAYKYNNLLACD